MTNENPRFTVRLNATRTTPDYTDLLSVVTSHYRTLVSAEAFLGPYNARQRSNQGYISPSRELLQSSIKQGGMNEITYMAFISSLIRFCESTKGQRALPHPHPSTIHSIQLPQPAFEIKQVEKKHEVLIPGCKSLFVQGLRNPENIKFIIVRPKMGSVGTSSAKDWEIMFFNQNYGYIPTWTDSTVNPRYVGF